jgi:hypothetical protein
MKEKIVSANTGKRGTHSDLLLTDYGCLDADVVFIALCIKTIELLW